VGKFFKVNLRITLIGTQDYSVFPANSVNLLKVRKWSNNSGRVVGIVNPNCYSLLKERP